MATGPIGPVGPLHPLIQQRVRAVEPAGTSAEFRELRDTYRLAVAMRRALADLRTALSARRPASPGTETTVATPGIAIATTRLRPGRPASLTSADEVNATPTSFSPRAPAFAGASTSAITATGAYDGSNGDTDLRFTVVRGGVVGDRDKRSGRIEIAVRDGSGREVDRLRFRASERPGADHELANGLVLRFGPGTIVAGDEFSIAVSASTPTAVDPDQPVDGTGATDPRFEYPRTVRPGSFDIDGHRVHVRSGDTLRDVLARISQTVPGIDATFDAATERVVLTRTDGRSDPIELRHDSSGFAAATKLAGGTFDPGQVDEIDTAMNRVHALRKVRAGVLDIGGAEIAIDPKSDSVRDVVDGINAAATGVTASIEDGAVVLRGDEPFAVADRGTRLLRALGIAEGVYEPTVETRGTPARRAGPPARRVVDALDRFGDAVNELFVDDTPTSALAALRSGIADAVARAMDGDGPRFDSGFGFQFDFSPSRRRVFRFASRADAAALRSALRRRGGREVVDLFLRPAAGGGDSLLDALDAAADAALREIRDRLGYSAGIAVRTTA